MTAYRPAPANAAEAALVRKRYNRRCVGAGFMYFGMYLVLQTAVSVLYVVVLMCASLGDGFDLTSIAARVNKDAVLLTGITNLLALMLYWIFFAARRCNVLLETQATRFRLPALLLMLPLGLCSYVFIAGLLSLLPENLLSGYAESSNALLSGEGFLPVLCLCVLAPLCEEVVFRGLLYARLKRGWNKPLALLVAGVLFGLMHGQPVWAAYAFLLSLLLSSVLDWYGSLWAAILLHMSFNASQYVVACFPDSLSIQAATTAAGLLLIPLILLAARVGRRSRCTEYT